MAYPENENMRQPNPVKTVAKGRTRLIPNLSISTPENGKKTIYEIKKVADKFDKFTNDREKSFLKNSDKLLTETRMKY